MGPPLETMRECLKALRAARRLLKIANPRLLSDVGVAGILLQAATRAAWLNVKVNLDSIDDEALKTATTEEASSLLDEASRLAGEISDGLLARSRGW